MTHSFRFHELAGKIAPEPRAEAASWEGTVGGDTLVARQWRQRRVRVMGEVVKQQSDAFAPQTTVGPYVIVAKIGAGGMGEVYRACDSRLGRAVALKVLPRDRWADPERRQRFEREARAIAGNAHPNVCALYDVGAHEGRPYLVMELVEGETLAQRLRRGRLAIHEALTCAIDIAAALDHVHRRGIVHRDVKPANVMITAAGSKLLDFGLAQLHETEPMTGAESPSAPDTLTDGGTILGTVQYMAPEQLEGCAVDPRADIFAFGAVLYEMLAGRPAFAEKSKAALIAAVLHRNPVPLDEGGAVAAGPDRSPVDLPPALAHVVSRCLAKSPDDRWQTAGDLRRELQWIADPQTRPTAATLAPPPRSATRRRRLTFAAAAVLLAGALVAGTWVLATRSLPRSQPILFDVLAPRGTTFNSSSAFLAVSPDGRWLTASAGRQGQVGLWLRALDSVDARPIAGTDGGGQPFWSADGDALAFKASGQLKRIDLDGGPAQVLGDAPEAQSGSWNRSGVIIFKRDAEGPIVRISTSGGDPVPVTTLDAARDEVVHNWPQFLPDGRRFLFLAISRTGRAVAYIGSLDSNQRIELFPTDSHVAYAAPGYLLYMQGTTLFARRFDAERLRTTGEPVAIAEHVERTSGSFRGAFSVSDTGVLAYRRGAERRLMWIDRNGGRHPAIDDAGHYGNPALSPNGRQLAVSRLDAATGDKDIWTIDLSRGTSTRLTFDPEWDDFPLWTPSGSHVLFRSGRNHPGSDVYRRPPTGGAEELVLSLRSGGATSAIPYSWTTSGELVFGVGTMAQSELRTWSEREHRDAALMQPTSFREEHAAVSPDGRLLAYVSNESGRREVYLRRIPDTDERWQVSRIGGREPAWRRDGGELFYLAADRRLMAVAIAADRHEPIGAEAGLFETGLSSISGTGYTRNQYVPTADGQRFLVNEPASEQSAAVTVVVNWPALSRR